MKKTAIAIALSIACANAAALDVPKGSKYDGRIRQAAYNPLDVVQIDGVIGTATHIILEPGEQYLIHAFGDSLAWEFAVKQNHVFLKPKEDRASTNLILVTDRRSYNFKLNYHPTKQAAAVYQVSFSYPDTEAKKAIEEQRKIALEAAWKAKEGRPNTAYEMAGHLDLSPVNAWDDGRFTYFKFPAGQDIPAIYQVSPDGMESLVNKHVEGDNVIMHKTAPVWMLRLGDRVLKIWNVGYRPRNGLATESNTVSPQVRRVLRMEK